MPLRTLPSTRLVSVRELENWLLPRIKLVLRRDCRRRIRTIPFDLDRVIFAELHTIMPQREANVCWTKCDFDDVFDAVILCSRIPPVSILQLKHRERDTRQIWRDITNLLDRYALHISFVNGVAQAGNVILHEFMTRGSISLSKLLVTISVWNTLGGSRLNGDAGGHFRVNFLTIG